VSIESEPTHPLVVVATEEGYLDVGEGPADADVDIDPRDQAQVQELIGADTVGATDMAMGVARMQPGMYHIRHHHPDGSEFYYFTKGTCVVHLDGQDVQAGPGTSMYIPPNCIHSIRNDTDEVVELVYGLSKPRYADIGLVYDE
jgi:quercetin dioxygenase-like cupin family protein